MDAANKLAVSVSEAAALLSVSRPTMYEITKRADFTAAFRVGGRTLVSVAGLQSWIEQQTAGGVSRDN